MKLWGTERRVDLRPQIEEIFAMCRSDFRLDLPDTFSDEEGLERARKLR